MCELGLANQSMVTLDHSHEFRDKHIYVWPIRRSLGTFARAFGKKTLSSHWCHRECKPGDNGHLCHCLGRACLRRKPTHRKSKTNREGRMEGCWGSQRSLLILTSWDACLCTVSSHTASESELLFVSDSIWEKPRS